MNEINTTITDLTTIFFTIFRLSKNGVEIIKTEHIIRPLIQSDLDIYSLGIDEFTELHGNLMIEKVKCADGIVRDLPTSKEHINVAWANEYPKNIIESKIWHYKKGDEIENILIDKMDSFLGESNKCDIKLKEKWQEFR